jgi:hypothetical protein
MAAAQLEDIAAAATWVVGSAAAVTWVAADMAAAVTGKSQRLIAKSRQPRL